MFDKIKAFFEFSSKNGLYLPGAYDAEKGKSSITLLFAHLSFTLCGCIILYLAYKDTLAGSVAALIYWIFATVFYLMRRISRFSADLDDKSISLESDNNEDKPQNNKEKE